MVKAREAAEQAKREEQEKERKAAREAQRPPKREIVENSDMDSDWRKGAQPAQPRIVSSKSFGERLVEGERHRESVPVVSDFCFYYCKESSITCDDRLCNYRNVGLTESRNDS